MKFLYWKFIEHLNLLKELLCFQI